MTKRLVMLCGVQERKARGVVEDYALANTYAFEYLKAYALKDARIKNLYDIRIKVFDAGSPDEEIIDCITLAAPDLIGFSCSLKNHCRVMGLARQIRLAVPQTEIIIGGPEAFSPERFMARHPEIDYAAIGEGEETFRELLLQLSGGRKFAAVDGLCYRESGQLKRSAPRQVIADLDRIPSMLTPARAADLSGIVLYETSRGCRNNCTYCLWSPYKKRYFSLARVKKELNLLLRNENITRIHFIDSDFDADPERAKSILRHVWDNRHPHLKISAFMDFQSGDRELMELAAGMSFEIPIGLQSVNPDILKAIGRSWFNLSRFEDNLKAVMKLIPASTLYIDIMYGLPGDDYGRFMESLLWCVDRCLPHINFFRLAIFPGTPLDRNNLKYGYVFDPQPPYLVYSSNSFSYDDILRIENTIVNFKVLRAFFDGEGLKYLASHLDLPGILDTLQDCTPDFAQYYTSINESNISGIEVRRLRPFVADWIKKALARQPGVMRTVEKLML